MSLERFGVSMESDLLRQLDAHVRQKGYASRSEALRDMVRGFLIERAWEDDTTEVAGTLTMVYDHHVHGLSDLLTDIQHEHYETVLSTMHIHLDRHNCLEVLVLRGSPRELQRVADRLIAIRGVKHGKLTMTSTGRDLR